MPGENRTYGSPNLHLHRPSGFSHQVFILSILRVSDLPMRGMWHPPRFDDPNVFCEDNIVRFSSSYSFFLSTVLLAHRFQTFPVHLHGYTVHQ